MELFENSEHYIVSDGGHSLWCSRKDGHLVAREGLESFIVTNAICLGQIYGVIGKISFSEDSEILLLITGYCHVGKFPGGHDVFGISKIGVLPLSTTETPQFEIDLCKVHHYGNENSEKTKSSESHLKSRLPLKKTWNTIKTVTSQAKIKKKDLKDRNKFERRITEELVKMFTDSVSFYYSHMVDLTNCIQRQFKQGTKEKPLWHRVDQRFFWNYNMVKELIDQGDSQADHWILPIIQGCIQIQKCVWDPDSFTALGKEIKNEANCRNLSVSLRIIIISRRSRHRAGTRYRRRGVDICGKVANYVETEQIVEYGHHLLSFVQVRGSVPVYWSQPGYRYRPPPQIDKGEQETQIAFEKHFEEELSIYNSVAIISLVEQSGKEKVIADAYLNHILNYNSDKLTYITFDFHEYCRGMRFENVSVLVSSIQDVIQDMLYCWADDQGIICEQKKVFRVNCIDCLDRTNVVQMSIAKAVLEIQFLRLGMLPPEGSLPSTVRNTLQIMWANNGDSVSRQYAGTAALKGDYTRTGERRLAGVMKDGYNSANRYYMSVFKDIYQHAGINIMVGESVEGIINELEQFEESHTLCLPNSLTNNCVTHNDLLFGPESHLVMATVALCRYYLNRFKDAYRQASFDIMQGNTVSEDELHVSPDRDLEDDSNFILNQSEHIRQLIDDCKKIILPDSDFVIGGWALIDADPVTGDPGQQDVDSILFLTSTAYYVVEFDDEIDRIASCEAVSLIEINKIELGLEPSMFKSKYHCIRLNYTINGEGGFFHMFRSSNVRFFNNMATVIKTEEEAFESLKAICDTLLVALEALHHKVAFYHGKLEKKQSKTECKQLRSSRFFGRFYVDITSLSSIPRNLSEGQLLAIKSAGSKALSNMTSQIAKLNPVTLHSSFRKKSKEKNGGSTKATTPVVPQPTFQIVSFSDSEDDTSGVETKVHEESGKSDVLLESCGILVTGKSKQPHLLLDNKNENVSAIVKDFNDEAITEGNVVIGIGNVCQTLVLQDISADAPEIHVTAEQQCVGDSEDKLVFHQSFETVSQSPQSSVDETLPSMGCKVGSVSNLLVDTSVKQVMKTSRSDGAIQEIHDKESSTNSTTCKLNIQKDNLLSPLFKLAKGVQNLGMNVQKATNRHHHPHRQATANNFCGTMSYEQFCEKCRHCRTRIIQL